ncbi:hypothetical protein [Microbacterium sp. ZXX196]|uniref:hypothetical protein n=1 Tax=Microbacterium sp. ZXX196 TaxID=2609291 RepID=UPI0012B7A523|nr:hypothetical protein [Microbacterium sp. ZXX196]MTE24340.1 hypothetical protein [Microbacterium sp. ZXX196]
MADAPELADLIAVRRKPSRQAAERHFWAFEDTLAERTEAFAAEAIARTDTRRYSIDSLDVVERLFLERITAPSDLDDPATTTFFFDVFRYLGETILRTSGGHWEWEELWETDAQGAGLPFIRVNSSESFDTGGTINIYSTLLGAAGTRTGTYFRELATAVLDSFGETGPIELTSGWRAMALPDPTRANPTLRTFLSEQPAALAAFDTVYPEIAPLDNTRESLDRIEHWLLHRYPDTQLLTADVENPDLVRAARAIAATFVALGGGRIYVVDAAQMKPVRESTPKDAYPYVQRVSEHGLAGYPHHTWTYLRTTVKVKTPGSPIPPRSGRNLRHNLDVYASEDIES